MKAIILNSGMGTRMGTLTSDQPKCMTELSPRETILSRQLNMLIEAGITDVVITTGYRDDVLTDYVKILDLPLNTIFVKNDDFETTNYIYSIYCAREHLEDDVLLMHGDMVFENSVLDDVVSSDGSCVTVSSTVQLPEKDFKAVLKNGKVDKIGIEFFDSAVAAQPLYKLLKDDWMVWLDKIAYFCENNNRKCYAENAFNEVSEDMNLEPLDVEDRLCNEVDNPTDLKMVSSYLNEIENRTVYMCFSTDILHGGHIDIINKARKLGKIIIGVLSDEVIASYKRYPLLSFEDRKKMFSSIAGVYKVVSQSTLSYRENLEKYRPDFVVHGDDWQEGFQKPIRDEVAEILDKQGGRIIEFPYASDKKYIILEKMARAQISMPDIRRGRLKRELALKGFVTAMEAHDGLTGLVVENTVVNSENSGHQFDAMWISSLCDSTAKGKPDIELVDMSSRFRTIEDIMEVTSKPIIFDGDTGGREEHFVYTVRTLERLGVSMVIIEDKVGLKRNSLFGTEASQVQDSIEHFCKKISAGKKAQRTSDFMICARIESLILAQGIEDAINRAKAYVEAGADAIMIHSKSKSADEIFEFVERFRLIDKITPLVVVPTTYNYIKEEEFRKRGVNVVIYANQFMRATVPVLRKTAETILTNRRSKECDDFLMDFKDIIRLIPEEDVN